MARLSEPVGVRRLRGLFLGLRICSRPALNSAVYEAKRVAAGQSRAWVAQESDVRDRSKSAALMVRLFIINQRRWPSAKPYDETINPAVVVVRHYGGIAVHEPNTRVVVGMIVLHSIRWQAPYGPTMRVCASP